MTTEAFGIPIITDPALPNNIMKIVHVNGEDIIPITGLKLEIENGIEVPKGAFPDMISGEIICEIKCDTTGMKSAVRFFSEAMLQCGDAWEASGQMNRHDRKTWRKSRRRIVSDMRREDARQERRRHGLAHF